MGDIRYEIDEISDKLKYVSGTALATAGPEPEMVMAAREDVEDCLLIADRLRARLDELESDTAPPAAVPEWLNDRVMYPSDVPDEIAEHGQGFADFYRVGYNHALRWVEEQLSAAPQRPEAEVKAEARND